MISIDREHSFHPRSVRSRQAVVLSLRSVTGSSSTCNTVVQLLLDQWSLTLQQFKFRVWTIDAVDYLRVSFNFYLMISPLLTFL